MINIHVPKMWWISKGSEENPLGTLGQMKNVLAVQSVTGPFNWLERPNIWT